MANERYIGTEIANALKVPCTAPTAGDVLTAGDSSLLTGMYRKIGGASVDPNTEWAGGHLIRNGDFGVFGDGTSAMPDGWAMSVGTYGSGGDLYVEATTVRGGKYALKMRTSTATAFVRSVYDPVVKDAWYAIQADIQQSDATAGNDVNVSVTWYDSALGSISTSTTNIKATTASTWTRKVKQMRAPSTARWAKIKIAKASGSFDVYVDRLNLQAVESAAPGSVVNFERYTTGAHTTGSTTVPLDDTVPTGTEGIDAGFGYSYSPRMIGSTLHVRGQVIASSDTSAIRLIGFINKDDGAALAVSSQYLAAAGEPAILAFAYSETVTSVSAATWRIRVGGHSASTTRINGAAAREFGGVNSSFIEFTEYAPA